MLSSKSSLKSYPLKEQNEVLDILKISKVLDEYLQIYGREGVPLLLPCKPHNPEIQVKFFLNVIEWQSDSQRYPFIGL